MKRAISFIEIIVLIFLLLASVYLFVERLMWINWAEAMALAAGKAHAEKQFARGDETLLSSGDEVAAISNFDQLVIDNRCGLLSTPAHVCVDSYVRGFNSRMRDLQEEKALLRNVDSCGGEKGDSNH